MAEHEDFLSSPTALLLKCTHGLHGFGSGCYSQFFQLWMRRALHLPADLIGLTCSCVKAAQVLGVPSCSALLDCTRDRKRFFSIIVLANGLLKLSYVAIPLALAGRDLLGQHSLYISVLLCLIVGEVVHQATYVVLDTLTLMLLPDHLLYGRIRLWAGLLYAVSNLIMGFVIALPMFDISWMFFFFSACFTVIALVWCCRAPLEAAAAAEVAEPYCARLRGFCEVCDGRMAELWVIIFGMGIASSATSSFVFLLIDDLGGSTVLMGVAIALNIVTEVPIFHFSKQIIEGLTVRGVIYVGVIGYLLRLGGYMVAWSPWVVLLVEPLHGITFALIWSNLAVIAADVAPEGLEGTTQGLLNGVYGGLGGVTGTLLGGMLYKRSQRLMFGSFATMMSGVLLLMLLLDACRAVGRSRARQRALTEEICETQGNQVRRNSVLRETLMRLPRMG